MYLAIDTSTDMAGLAVADEGRVLAEVNWNCGRNHSVELLPRLERLLADAGLDIKATRGVVVARGPGSYNGLRVGLSTAKGLVLSLDVPLVGIGTLEVDAYPHAGAGLPIRPIADAARGEVATAVYQQADGEWRRLVEEHITTLEELYLQITTRTVFCGEYVLSIGSQLKERLGDKALVPPPEALRRRAAFLAELGRRRLEAGDYDNPATLQPLYLRRPSITRPKPR